MDTQGCLLVFSVAVVGILHTLVPDHWVPITLVARQRGWSTAETARAAAVAGTGHTVSTLLLGFCVWFAGAEMGVLFGHIVDVAASVALVAFGLWIAVSAWRELPGGHGRHHHGHDRHHPHDHHHLHDHDRPHDDDALYVPIKGGAAAIIHEHAHRHGDGRPHVHLHDHSNATAHAITADVQVAPPLHEHLHKTGIRTALLLILGSSPMIEGLPAFFAASRYGIGLLAIMGIIIAVSTIATYVVLCSVSVVGMNRINLGPLERYGEVISGLFIGLIGSAF